MKRHRADLLSFGFGLFFAAAAGWWAIAYYLDWDLRIDVPHLGWIVASILILVGLLGVVASLRGEKKSPPTEPAGFDRSAPTIAEPEPGIESGATVADPWPTETGPTETGPSESGPTETGPSESGRSETGPSESGRSESWPAMEAPAETDPTAEFPPVDTSSPRESDDGNPPPGARETP
jgi:hypothetical protein